MPKPLTQQEQLQLLNIAYEAVRAAAFSQHLQPIDLNILPVRLQENGASFVTLTIKGRLRGCIGSLEAFQPLAKDVQQRARQAAVEDPRFPPLRPAELQSLDIEISYLTPAEPLLYEKPEDLPRLLRPGMDGVVLADGYRRATFLPQVWEQLPTPEEFLNHLCMKMGASADLWQRKILDVSIYQVQEFKRKPE